VPTNCIIINKLGAALSRCVGDTGRERGELRGCLNEYLHSATPAHVWQIASALLVTSSERGERDKSALLWRGVCERLNGFFYEDFYGRVQGSARDLFEDLRCEHDAGVRRVRTQLLPSVRQVSIRPFKRATTA